MGCLKLETGDFLTVEKTGVEQVEVYFDDFKVTHVKSPVIQSDEYYPFGLRFGSYAREDAVPNKTKLFQGQEHIDDLGLNWDSFKWRNHQPDIGRFFNIDPLADKYVYNSPYAFSENHVTTHVELEGLEKVYIFDQQNNPDNKRVYTGRAYVEGTNREVKGPYRFSSFPNNDSQHNTLNEGTHKFNNQSGHSGGTKKGLNIVNEDGERVAPGTSPSGADVEMTVVNVHSGVDPEDNGGLHNRGSAGCPTCHPSDAESFFENFDFSGGNTGNAEGTVTIFRGESDDASQTEKKLQIQQELQKGDFLQAPVKSDATRLENRIPVIERNKPK